MIQSHLKAISDNHWKPTFLRVQIQEIWHENCLWKGCVVCCCKLDYETYVSIFIDKFWNLQSSNDVTLMLKCFIRASKICVLRFLLPSFVFLCHGRSEFVSEDSSSTLSYFLVSTDFGLLRINRRLLEF